MKNLKKLLALFITVAIAFSAFGTALVFADEEQTFPISLDFQVINSTVNIGDSFKINTMFNFTDEDMATAEGIRSFRYGIRFDPNYFEILNPSTMQPIDLDENGMSINKDYYIFGNLGVENAFTTNMQDDKTFVLLYGGRNASSDIYSAGAFAQFAFRVKSDINITQTTSSKIEVINPEFFVNNSNTAVEVSTNPIYMTITPLFNIPDIKSKYIGENLVINGRFNRTPKDDEPLNVTIANSEDTENVIDEKAAAITGSLYNVEFELSSDKYSAGIYRITMTYGTTSAYVLVNITEKPEPIPNPEPTEPDDGNKDDDGKDDNNTGGNSSGNGGTGGSGIGLGDKTNVRPNTSTDTKPDTDTNKDNQNNNAPDNKPSYPTDIDGHWAKSNIEYVYDHSLMNGYPEGIFAPENSITRAEFATVMSKFMELGEDSAAADKFSDVDGHWAKGYIGALYSREIVNGVSDIEFAPDANITRQEIATILARAFKLTEKSVDVFADNDSIAEWASDFVYMTKAAGYMQGDENNNFNPIANATRAEVATIIYRLHTSK